MCANVAGLLLARIRVREREVVLRLAIGADRWRVVRQLVTECLTLSAFGMVAGIGLGAWVLRAFQATAPGFLPDVTLVSIDARFAVVALVVSAACGLLFSIAPAFAAVRSSLAGVLRDGTTATGRTGWLRHGLVVGQVAAALILLTTTSAALGVVARLMRVDLGFHGDRSVVFDLTLPESQYHDAAAIMTVVDRIEARIAEVPGVRRVGVTNVTPGSSLIAVGLRLERASSPDSPDQQPRYATLLTATTGYFDAMGVRLLAGRRFSDTDRNGAGTVVILSEAAARALWSDPQAAVGQRLHTKNGSAVVEPEVIGVVADVRLRSATAQQNTQAYFPMAQSPPFGGIGVVVEAADDPAQIVPAVRAALKDVDRELPPYNVKLVRDLQTRYLANQRLTLAVTSIFAAISLLLSAIGLYGVLTQLVTERSREIGIRMALGANRARVRWAVVWTGVRVSALGVAVGALGSTAAVRLIARFVPALDAPSMTGVAANAMLLVAVAIVAAWIPARRASAVDPLVALRAM
jgi:predicted permease